MIAGDLEMLDTEQKYIKLKGKHERLPFDKVLLASGAFKSRLNQEYSNVFYLEDRQSHAKCHNEILKAKTIMVMGGTLEAYQTASAIREYLDEIQYFDT